FDCQTCVKSRTINAVQWFGRLPNRWHPACIHFSTAVWGSESKDVKSHQPSSSIRCLASVLASGGRQFCGAYQYQYAYADEVQITAKDQREPTYPSAHSSSGTQPQREPHQGFR